MAFPRKRLHDKVNQFRITECLVGMNETGNRIEVEERAQCRPDYNFIVSTCIYHQSLNPSLK